MQNRFKTGDDSISAALQGQLDPVLQVPPSLDSFVTAPPLPSTVRLSADGRPTLFHITGGKWVTTNGPL